MDNTFEYYIETNELHFKYAKGEPALKDREFHNYNEFVFFISGDSYFVSKNIQQKLTAESLVIIPKEHFHQFRVDYPETYIRCILAFRETSDIADITSEVMDTIKVISSLDLKIVALFKNIIEIVKSDLTDSEKVLHIRASLVQLLIYLKLNPFDAIRKNVSLSPVVSQALNIIDKEYTEKLTVDEIAKSLYISPSTLSHKFTDELNISVYQYITKKRLSSAYERIRQGESLTSAALNSGFGDYSCFYRLYKKYNKT